MDAELLDIPLDKIKVQKHNVRHRDLDVGIEDLAASIRANGLIQPIAAYLDSSKDTYFILTGQRRLNAYHKLNEDNPGEGYDKIPCLVSDEPETDEKKMSLSLAENITQLQMSNPDLVKAVTDLYNTYGDYEIVQREFGITRYMVEKYVRMSRLPQELKDAIYSGEIHPKPKTAENAAIRAVDSTKYTKDGPIPIANVISIAKSLANNDLTPDDITPDDPEPKRKPKSKLQIDLALDIAEKLTRVADSNGETEKLRATQYVVDGVERDYPHLE